MIKNQEYALQYADYAMAQMRRYGILAFTTLAQDIPESGNGQSRLARNGDNHFGIEATSSWIAEGGKHGIYIDDRPNEKFCSHDSAGDSYEYHSRFLKENSRCAGCFKLSPDDYKGWARSIEKAGYAAGGEYVESLQKIIEQNGLQKYDRQVMQEMTAQGRQFGAEYNPLQTPESAEHGTGYSSPVKQEESLFITSPFGIRQDPLDSTKQQMHKGVDIRCRADAVPVTEGDGKVVAVNQNKNTPGGKSLAVEYIRTDGSKVQCTYMYLKEISAKVGDMVQAGGRLGTSGNTGTRTTREYLYFGVKNTYVDGTERDIDPAAYLAEIAQEGHIKSQMPHNGNDLLAKYEATEGIVLEKNPSPDGWMRKLPSPKDSGVGISECNDPIVEMVTTAFVSLMLLATQIGNREEEEQKTAISAAMDLRTIDLRPLLPNMRNYGLTIGENDKVILEADNGELYASRRLTASELSRLSATLNNGTLMEEAEQMYVTGMLNMAILSEAASQNFEQGTARQQG